MTSDIKKRIDIAARRIEADLVLKNAKIIDVFSEEIIEGDIAISDDRIAGIGEYSGKEEIDLCGKYVVPGLIDGHVHIESSMVTPGQFAKAIVPHGTTTIIADPHEIANVCGLEGIEYILEGSENSPLDVFVMLPSCVPSTAFENSGAKLSAEELEKMINHDRVLGLGELMDYPSVIGGNEEILKKIKIAGDKIKDGHGPEIDGKDLNAYVTAGISTEHECTTIEEMKDRISLGMYILIREGSAARNLEGLIKGVNRANLRRVLFCTDDRHPEDILKDGHIDNNVRLAIKNGIEPICAIKIASLNAAECYRLYDRGAIAPGYMADLVVVDHISSFNVEKVFKNGKLVANEGQPLFQIKDKKNPNVLNTVNLKEIHKDDLKIKLDSDIVNVIKLLPHSLVTKKAVRKVDTENGYFKYHDQLDILKLVVVERHKGTGNIGLGLVENFNLKNGAIASTIAHDSHNLIVIGDNDEDILLAIEEIRKIGGGVTICSNGKVMKSLPLPIGGLMSDRSLDEVNKELKEMLDIAYGLGVNKEIEPFMTLAFLALPVIPELKLTDMGLFDVTKFDFVDISVKN
ncbi:adenine deaminase [Anaeromicrobium sediminis]|uniref:Adenine deaminase n=1 Tax=Anaeromicrobium sediminis TaxID=1478221 RepID=A0A267MMW6_9FIRM|nr:adenine deaminase [Anaeromicrobium sediminis]PAB60215.1 adenine deaminase [Anaeromicrobium sediminis]